MKKAVWAILPTVAFAWCGVPHAGADVGNPESSKVAAQTQSLPDLRAEKIREHERLAELHRQEADCLKAGRPVSECDQQLKKGCPIGELNQCVSVSQEELRKHEKTHQLGGRVGPGDGVPAAPPPEPAVPRQPE